MHGNFRQHRIIKVGSNIQEWCPTSSSNRVPLMSERVVQGFIQSSLETCQRWSLCNPVRQDFPILNKRSYIYIRFAKQFCCSFCHFSFFFALCMLWRTWLHYVDNLLVGTGMPYGVLHRLLCSLQIKTRKNNPPTTNTFSCSDCSSQVNDGCIMPTVQTLVIDSVNTANSQNSVLMQHCQYILLFPSFHMTWR